MIEALVGLIGAAIGIGLFLFGFYMGGKYTKPQTAIPDAVTDAAKQRRLDMIAEQDAFQKLVNYNVDVAYNSRSVKDTTD